MVNVVRPNGKATPTATMKITTAHATGMVATAVMHRATSNFAASAPAWIPRNKSATQSADRRTGLATECATMKTTTAVVDGIKVIAVAIPRIRIKRSSTRNASVWIPTTVITNQKRRNASANAVTRTGLATVFVMKETTTAPVNMMQEIAVGT